MIQVNSNNLVVEIESPLSIFNNLQFDICEKINNIFYGDLIREEQIIQRIKVTKNQLLAKNQILFNEKTITLFNFIKLSIKNNKVMTEFIGEMSEDQHINVINIFLDSFKEIKTHFLHYVLIYDQVANNFDAVPSLFVNDVFQKLSLNTKQKNKYKFLLPYKDKVKKLYDSDNKIMEHILNRYSYVIEFTKNESRLTFEYKIYRLTSSDLDESKSLDNLQLLEVDIIKKDKISMRILKPFLTNIFYYGEILTNQQNAK